MSPNELAAAGAHPWIVNGAFLVVAIIGVLATWRKTIREAPAAPKPRAEIAIGDAAILDGKPIREGAASIGEAAKQLALIEGHIRKLTEALAGILDIMKRKQEADEIDEREELVRRMIHLEEQLARKDSHSPQRLRNKTRRPP